MQKIKETPYYKEAFQELNYSFGDFYLFENLIVAEIKEDVVFNWKNHGSHIVNDIVNLYETDGRNIIYISNRINDYSVVPSDWLKFFKLNKSLKAYGVVSQDKNYVLEKLFMKNKMRNFNTITTAIEWAKKINNEETLSKLNIAS